MLTDEEFNKLTERLEKGKAWIWARPDGWAGTDPRTREGIELWKRLADLHLEALVARGLFTTEQPKHSKAWNDMKFREALVKWKHTLKANRGTDPRLLPRESFI